VPAEWKTDGAVLCVAGRGPLDDAAAEIFGQLLSKHGLGARFVPHASVGRSTIANLDVTGALMVVLCYVEIAGTPAHLRYLLRRLRKHVPDARIMVGVWQADHPVFRDESIRSVIGGDDYFASLRDGVVRSLQVACGDERAAPAPSSVVAMAETRSGGPGVARRYALPTR
jgi:hypothetical protein